VTARAGGGGRRRRGKKVAIAAGLALAPLAAPATANIAQWTQPARVSAKGRLATYPSVAFDRRGTATALWIEARAGGRYSVPVSSARHDDRQRWTPPVPLSRGGKLAVSPQLAVAPSGVAVAAWNVISTSPRKGPPPAIDIARRRSATASWSGPVRISPRHVQATRPSVGIDNRGHAIAVWTMRRGRVNQIQASVGAPGRGAWSAPNTVAQSKRRLLAPRLSVDPEGDAIAVWQVWTHGGPLDPGGVRTDIAAAIKPAGRRSWLPPRTLGREIERTGQGVASFESPGPRVAIDRRGNATVVWQADHHGHILAEAAQRHAGEQRWTSPVSISRRAALVPDIAMDPRGDATAVWLGDDGRVESARKSADATRWSSPASIAGADPESAYPHIVMNPHGDAIATWTGRMVHAAERQGPHASWRRATRLGSGGVPQVALGRRGQAIVVWQRPANDPMGIEITAAFHGSER
jgi:hypothetical protein